MAEWNAAKSQSRLGAEVIRLVSGRLSEGGFGGRLGTVGGKKHHGETHVGGNEDERRQARSQ